MTFDVELIFDEVVEAMKLYLSDRQPELMQSFCVSDVFQHEEHDQRSVFKLTVSLEPIGVEGEGDD